MDTFWADFGTQQGTKDLEAIGNFTRAFSGFYGMLARSCLPFVLSRLVEFKVVVLE